MTIRIVVAGCRSFNRYDKAKPFLDNCLCDLRNKYNIVIVSGGANGADAFGERYAKENGFEIERYPAEWKKYGKRAGPIRNKQKAEICDCVICFWDEKSKGTKTMVDYAKKLGKTVYIMKI